VGHPEHGSEKLALFSSRGTPLGSLAINEIDDNQNLAS
jgi:hypothetical protein